jgi:ERCC4-type nuclease
MSTIVATVFVDDRENALERKKAKASRKPAKPSPVHYLEPVFDADNRANSKKPTSNGGGTITYKITRLTLADYLIVLTDASGAEIVAAAIERKRWKDLASTITGSRAETQPRNLRLAKLKYGSHVYYLAEGSMTYSDDYKIGGGGHGQPFKTLHSKLRHETIRGIPFIQTKDPEHTVQMLTKMTRDFIKMHTCGELAFPLQSRSGTGMLEAYAHHLRQIGEQFSTLMIDGTVDNIDYTNTRAAIQEINETLEFLLDIPDEDRVASDDLIPADVPDLFTKVQSAGESDIISLMWEAIPGITKNSAPLISEKYKLTELFNTTEDSELDTLETDISEMRFASGTRIGKQAAKIVANFRTDSARDAASIKVLCAIPRVTEPVASAIIAKYGLAYISDKKFEITWLQEIVVGKRAIGKALASKIRTLLQYDM